MSDTPPDWVLLEAAKRSKLSNDTPRQRAILFDTNPSFRALCDLIERHEAFRQEVSDVASVCAQHFCENSWTVGDRQDHVDMLHRLIIPATKPDPLVDVFCKGLWSEAGLSISTKEIRAALEARGLEIREKNDD